MEENLTWNDILEYLKQHPEILQDNVTVHCIGEFYPCSLVVSGKENDVLEENSLFLKVCE